MVERRSPKPDAGGSSPSRPAGKGIFILMFEKVKQFIKEVRFELTKVTWTTRQELIYSTIIVIVVSLVLAVFVGAVDVVLSNLATMFLG